MMTLKRKIITGVGILCLILLQYHLTKHEDQPSPVRTELPSTPLNNHTDKTTEWETGSMAPYVSQQHVVQQEAATRRDLSISINDQKAHIISQKLKPNRREPIILPDDFNSFEAKENMKYLLFSDGASNGKTNTLSEAEKWQIIDSGARAW